MASKGKLHRDISEGNILCSRPRTGATDEEYLDSWSKGGCTAEDSDKDEDTSEDDRDFDWVLNNEVLVRESGKIE